MSRSANDGNKRWAIAPPPPTSVTRHAQSGEHAVSLERQELDIDSDFFARTSTQAPTRSRMRPAPATLAPEAIEPSDSDRPTAPAPPGLGFSERDFPTIPAAPMIDTELSEAEARPVPPVPTGRGIFLETLRVEADPGAEHLAPASITPLSELSIDFDADEGL